MSAGDYDVRTRSVDSRGQTSDWSVVSDMFELANGRPLIVADPVPTVMCDTSTRVSMVGHVSDPETPLGDLVSLRAVAKTSLRGTPTPKKSRSSSPLTTVVHSARKALRSRLTTVEITPTRANFPYGTLLFNASLKTANPDGQALPIQVVDEGGSGLLTLSDYLSDTDDNGQPADISALSIEILDNSNPEVFTVELRDKTLGFETVDDDVNGETTVKNSEPVTAFSGRTKRSPSVSIQSTMRLVLT